MSGSQAAGEPGRLVDYYTQRKLHPRTGDVGAFNGRVTGDAISPRTPCHDDFLQSAYSHQTDNETDLPSEAGVELEGRTNDGGVALKVGFDEDDYPTDPAPEHPAHPQHAQQVGSSAAATQLTQCSCLNTSNLAKI